ncbi:hypothetical protein [Acetivibrio clariflavus]|uniref:Uncharacterized protein n=1 Tax=Acetivibrio clariflavus (strain DSM 19732 / NBRC 101661 / EBR45) TaxID=720554 RepID=G8M380_ACECE|nr:hypothetical protein [Acetivibrio clariflavus]AEV70400.1 hypothetical protein Clocl_3960 [Acetivibrio clariflavus DSM 19732]HOQ01708.1 hypothetical protein [Acetivibrio clariflavus]HPU40836.1 hypothetical protein [Acetivibrio clariflavus]
MNNSLLVLLGGNIFVSTIYFLYRKITNKDFNFPKFLLCIFIPYFGVFLFIIADFLVKNGFLIESSLYEIDGDEEEFDEIISDTSNVDYINTLPIVDVLEIKDINKKRKYAFKSVKGDFKKIYPFLEKIVRDDDPEVVHYASTAISDYRQKINENYSESRECYLKDPKNINVCENFIRAFLDLIIWEEFNNTNTFLKRKELSEIFDFYFSSAQNIEKEFYVQKIKNEIAIKNFKEAEKTCDKFAKAYPNSYKPYLSKLEFYYFSGNIDGFKDTLKKMRSKDIVLSKRAYEIVTFWRNHLEQDIRGAI